MKMCFCVPFFQCTVASKFLFLRESVRDAADLYLSLKYPPTLFVCDTPCGLARHMDLRCPDVAKHLWDDNAGCFEKPQFDRKPNVCEYDDCNVHVHICHKTDSNIII
jgi:hypothetical protein